MKQRTMTAVSARRLTVSWFTLLLLLLAPVAAQQNMARRSADLGRRLQTAEKLEQAGRWREAIDFYRRLLEEIPGDAALMDRLDRAKIHYDVTRRYRDYRFVREQVGLSAEQALQLYTEVLDKIDAYHVDRPRWDEFVRRGLRQTDVALENRLFRRHHPVQLDARQIAAYQHAVKQHIDVKRVQRLTDARQAAWTAAHLARQHLGVAPQAVLTEFVAAAVRTLDRYSAFLTPGQLDEVFSQIEGNFVGIGIELKGHADGLEIIDVIEDGPAGQAGLKPGDVITSIDGHRLAGETVDTAADRLRGEEGSRLRLTARAKQAGAPERRYELVRRRVEVPSVTGVRMVDAARGTGYLRIISFQKSTPREIDEALWRLHRQGMRSLVIDVRGNPGGLLTAAVELADKFLTEGTIVTTHGRSRQEDFTYTAHYAGTWQLPLVVLVDRNSASASEIFAAAIADHHRGTVVGEKSYGKGSVQGIFPLRAAQCGLRLTTARFYSPTGRAISHQGVTPDVIVREVAKPQVGGTAARRVGDTDPVLTAALAALRPHAAPRTAASGR